MTLSEEDIKKIAQQALQQLGQSVSKEAIEQVVKETVNRLQNGNELEPVKEWKTVKATQIQPHGERIIVTAFGKNRIGILAKMTQTLAQNQCDILDLTQKLMQDFFTIMLLVDISPSPRTFEQIKKDLIEAGEALDLKVIVQHEDIFNAMHRI